MKKDLFKKVASSKTAQDLSAGIITVIVFSALCFVGPTLDDKYKRDDKIVYKEHMKIKEIIKELEQQPKRDRDIEYYKLKLIDEELDKKDHYSANYHYIRNQILKEYKKRNR